MTITKVGNGTWAYATGATTAFAGVTTNAVGDRLFIVYFWKPNVITNSNGPADPAGWTLITKRVPDSTFVSTGGYSSEGADTGNTGYALYYKDVVGSPLATSVGFTATNTTVHGCIMLCFRKTGTSWASLMINEGWVLSTPTSPLSKILDLNSGFGLTAGDMVLCGMVIPTDITTPAQFSAQSLSQSGVTFGTFAEIAEADTTGGDDMGGWLGLSPVTSGPDTVQNLTITATLAGTLTNVRGPVWALRIREVVSVVTNPTDYWGAAA